jgi:predicted RNase H-like HicB family nuclease
MLKKDIEYYKNLEYSVIVEKQEQDGEIWYIAYSTELGKFACYGRGETQVDALNNFNEEKETFIEFLFNEGNEIPEPNINKTKCRT